MKRIQIVLPAAVLLVVALAVGRNVLSRDVRAGKAVSSDNSHVLSIAYYSTRGDWDSVLSLNNATHNPLTASLTLYSLDGAASPLTDVFIQPDLHATLRVSDLIAKANGRGRFQEGSIELRFNGSSMDLGAQLTVSDTKHRI